MTKPASTDEELIRNVVQLYFTGTYHGRIEEVKRAFHPDARIVGSINGTLQDWSLGEFIERVTTKPTAADNKETFDKEILFVDITHHTAMVKTRVSAAGHVFIDYITLLKIEDKWVIRFKSFTT